MIGTMDPLPLTPRCNALVIALVAGSTAVCPDLTLPAATPLPSGGVRILVYGDSNSDNGHRYTDGGSIHDSTWAEYLSTCSNDYEVINESSAGETIRWMMDAANPYGSFDTKIEDVLERHGPVDLVLIQLGTNDARFAATANPPDDQTYDLDTTCADMRELIARIGAHPHGARAAVVILAPPPTYDCQGWPDSACLPNRLPSQGFTLATQPFMCEMGIAFHDSIAVSQGVGIFDLFALFKSIEDTHPYTDSSQHALFPDGIHFTETGHRLVAERMHAYLTKMRGEAAAKHAGQRREGRRMDEPVVTSVLLNGRAVAIVVSALVRMRAGQLRIAAERHGLHVCHSTQGHVARDRSAQARSAAPERTAAAQSSHSRTMSASEETADTSQLE